MKLYEYILKFKENATQKLKEIERASGQTTKKVNLVDRAFGRLKTTVATLAIGAALFAGVKGAAALGIEMEQTRVSFTTFLKSADLANQTIAKLNDFSNVTPFDNAQVIKAGKGLLAFGTTADELIPTLRKIGDISAGTGKDFNELAIIYGKARIAGTLYAEDINQLVEAGVPIMGEFAKALGVTEDKVKKMASEGKLKFKDLEQAFTNLTGEGGLFFDLMAKQSATVGGKISTLQGKFQMLGISVGQSFLPVIGKFTDFALDVVNNLRLLTPVLSDLAAAFFPLKVQLFESATAMGILSSHQSTGLRMVLALRSGIESIIPVIKTMVKWVSNGVKIFIENIDIVKSAIKAYLTYKVGIYAFGVVLRAHAILLAVIKAATIAYNTAVLITTGGIKGATVAMKAFGVASKASGLGVVVGLLAAAGAAYLLFAKRVDKAKLAQERFNKLQQEAQNLLNVTNNASPSIENIKSLNERQLQELKSKLLDAQAQLEDKILNIKLEFKDHELIQKIKDAKADLVKAANSGLNVLDQLPFRAKLNQLEATLENKVKKAAGASFDELTKALSKNKKYLSLIDEQLKVPGLATAGAGGTGGAGADEGKLTDGIKDINGGGAKSVNVTVNLNNLIGEQQFNINNLKEDLKDMEEEVVKALLRVLGSANQAAAQ